MFTLNKSNGQVDAFDVKQGDGGLLDPFKLAEKPAGGLSCWDSEIVINEIEKLIMESCTLPEVSSGVNFLELYIYFRAIHLQLEA